MAEAQVEATEEEEEEEECPKCVKGAPAWMATFADMATLLMAFFVLILSFAEFNVPKFKQISGSFKKCIWNSKNSPSCRTAKRYNCTIP
jgi:chemotaxis protein MotB